MSKDITYKQAMSELEQILNSLNKEDFDIDTLGKKVKQATELLGLCRKKLSKAENDLEQIISQEN